MTAPFAEVGGCWVCGHDRFARFHQARFDLSAYRDQDPELAEYTGATVGLQRCRACGFGQPDRVPALPRFFDRMYDQRWSPDWVAGEFDATYKDLIFARVLDLLDVRVARGRRRLLDVGTHAGRFLRLARQAGWEVEGVEVNTRTATFAAAHTGAPVYQVPAAALHTIGQTYDAITLTDVLEHLPDPRDLLARARSLLAPGGWIAIKVPCGPAQLLKEQARELVRPGYVARLADNLVHVNHFSPSSLRLALIRAGFDSVHLEVAAPECPAGQHWSNRLRMGLYRAARLMPFGVHSPLALNLQACARRGPVRN
jgi:SAM-dependent methyltransferase